MTRYVLTLNWFVQIFLYHCILCFLQIKSVQLCVPQNAGDSLKNPLPPPTTATKSIINFFDLAVKNCRKIQPTPFTLTLTHPVYFDFDPPPRYSDPLPRLFAPKSSTSIWLFITKLNLQLVTKYLRQTLVFMWNRALRGFPDIYYFLKVLSLRLLNNSWGNSYIPAYLVYTRIY